MADFLGENGFFAIALTVGAFFAGRALQSRWKSPLINPILVAAVLIGTVLLLFGIPVSVYQSGCQPLQYMLTPATICYALSLYEQIGRLKKHLPAILAGIFCGTLVSLLSIRVMCNLFALDEVLSASLLPKSITTAIGMALSREAGGIASLSTAVIVTTGILGNVCGPVLCRLFGIRDEIAQGVAFGTASHAIGTSKAMELSELSGAVSSLSLTFAGLITVVLYSFFL